MSAWTDLLSRWASLVRRDKESRELAEELAFHVDMEAAKHAAAGMSEGAARRRAELTLGGRDRVAEAYRDASGVRALEDAVRDVRVGVRTLVRSPSFALMALLVLALGIGASTAIFSAVNALILEPLPFRAPDRLYMLWESNPKKGWEQEDAAPANFLDWRARVAAFEDVAAYVEYVSTKVLTERGEPQLLRGVDVTGNFFSVMGVRAALGRTFTAAETWSDAEPVVLLSDAAWRTRFGGDEAIIGRQVVLDGGSYRVVGVMPRRFSFPEENLDFWLPTGWDRATIGQDWFRRAHWISPVARLRRGVTPAEAEAELQAVAAQLRREHPVINDQMGAGMTPLQRFLLGETRTQLLVLLGAVLLLLLLACANVGNLLLVKATGRRSELAVRAALGAARGRLVRQVMVESAVLAVAGGALGLALGWVGTRLLERMQPEGLLRITEFSFDLRVGAFALLVSLGSAVLFGALPALLAHRASAADSLRESGRGRAPGRSAQRAAGALVVAEIALAVLLVSSAGLLVRSLLRLQQVDPGFDARNVLAVTLNPPASRYEEGAAVIAFYDELLERVRALPDVSAASATSDLPLRERGYTSDFFVQGRAPGDYGAEVVNRRVMPEYFAVMGVPLLRGRTFTAADRHGSERVAIINASLARTWFGDADPIGRRLITDRAPDSTSVWRTIVGVVGDERQSGLAVAPKIEILEPQAQDWTRRMTLVLRTDGDPAAVMGQVRDIVRDIDPDLPLQDAVPMATVLADSLARQRFLTMLLLSFASLALVLATVGVYGVAAQAARNRMQEMGVRVALGARAADITMLNLRRGLALTATGLGIGLVAALAATRAMHAMVYEIAPNDPVTFAAVAGVLAFAGIAASWLPARNAGRVDPATVLRSD